ncbi:glycosyltransferase family 4 protein [Marinobacter sp. F3R11]|uniref:glycosyltransferase family 4 protein n=1 Tax=Marinobacter sp. F3R11 TaxID=2267231 RepID=UPI00165107C1|nr:glycosyltransferase family 4 protein [Marinobacter sp. F3R11]
MFLNVISSPKGGGAELLVRELQKAYLDKNIECASIYLSGDISEVADPKEVLSENPRKISNIFKLRKKIKLLQNSSCRNLIIHAHLTWPFFYVVLATIGLRDIRLVYTEHNTTNKRRHIPLFWFIERFVYRRYSKVICISDGVYGSLKKWVGPKISERLIMIPNGSRIYQPCQRQPVNGRKAKLVSIGSLTAKKNLATAIKAVSFLRDQIESYEIIGEGPERAQLEKLIHQEHLHDLVHLVGWSDQIEDYLAKADIQLIPSLWEGFGLVAVEGMSTGLPVVASNVDGLREVLGSQNPAVTLVRDIEDPEAWAQAIKLSIENLNTHGPEHLALASRRQAEKFTLDAMADRYLEVYRSLL